MFYIYLIHNILNNKVYVGKTNDPPHRWRKHLETAGSDRERERYYIHRAIAKYGVDNFVFCILQQLDNENDQNLAEQYWIKFFNSKNNKYGYNLTDGGEGTTGRVISEATRQKMREKATGRKHTEETKELLKQISTGRKHTPEAKAKMSAANIGKVLSDDHCEKISKARKGMIFTEEHKENISKGKTGKYMSNNNPFFGKTHTEEVKEKSRGESNEQAKLTAVKVIEIREKYNSGNYSQQLLANEYGVSREQIGRITRGVDWKHLLPKGK